MNASDLCVAWIKHCEGCNLTAYWDVDGWSIGYGCHDASVTEGMTWTESQADAALLDSIQKAGDAVTSMVEVGLTQGQFDALTSFCYNEGWGHLDGSTLLRQLNFGEYDAACQSFYWVDGQGQPHGWIYAGGKISEGLIARRKGDQVLWNGGNPLA